MDADDREKKASTLQEAAPMKKRFAIACGVIVLVLLGGVLLAPHLERMIGVWGVGVHQRGITRELKTWEGKYGHVHTWDEARQNIGVLNYVQQYYVPGPNYHSDPETEAKLEAQRARTVQAIVSALKTFTGQDFGDDAARWEEWIEHAQPEKTAVKSR
jgi:hypothetical protein